MSADVVLQDVDGNAPVSLGSGSCATEEEGVNMKSPLVVEEVI